MIFASSVKQFLREIYGCAGVLRPFKYTKQTPNLVNWIVVDRAASRTRTSPICELWCVGDDRLRLPRGLFPPDPPYEWDS